MSNTKDKTEEVIIYKFSCDGYKDDNHDMKYFKKAFKAKVIYGHDNNTVLAYDLGMCKVYRYSMDEIFNQSHVMWTLNPDIQNYIIALMRYEQIKIYFCQKRIEKLNRHITTNSIDIIADLNYDNALSMYRQVTNDTDVTSLYPNNGHIFKDSIENT